MGLISKRVGKALINATVLGSADTIVTNLTTLDTIITKIHLYNKHTSAVTVTLAIVDDSASSVGTDDADDVVFAVSVGATKTEILGSQDCGFVLSDTGDSLQAYASTADKVNIFVWGFTLADQT